MAPLQTELPAIMVFERPSPPGQSLRDCVDGEGFEVHEAASPDAVERLLEEQDIHLVLLDIGDANGDLQSSLLDLCHQRRFARRPPIIVTGTRNTVSARVAALDLGADRYLARPFSRRELLAHMRALSRPLQAVDERPGDLCFSGWRLRPAYHGLLTPEGQSVALTHRELLLLATFANNPGVLLTRPFLKQAAQLDDTGKTARIVDLLIHRLRRKLRQGLHGSALIHTRHDKGYVFTSAVVRK
ncbi:MAG: response regulator transcription factor [Brevundimonas sp.]|uniref:response regulator transcription factor n=1 Tax=Brevundimonas sp. TaxID=1871086 RepID=UPI0025880FDB|nr:response regulator transcription factor [Brevundimonas sp.]MCV0413842.1 response regulator transcription factor [Brevundimonas sp.]